MQRAMAHYMPREMAVLGFVELAVSFAVIFAMVGTTGQTGLLPMMAWHISADHAAAAALLALSIGVVGLTIGLYQPDICLDRKRLLPAFCLAATLAFGILLLFSGGPGDAFTLGHALDTAKVFLAWLATIGTVRVVYSFNFVHSKLTRRVLIIGDEQAIPRFASRLRFRRGRWFEAVTSSPCRLEWSALSDHRIWGVVVQRSLDEHVSIDLLDCKLRGIRVLSEAEFNEHFLGRIDIDSLRIDNFLFAGGYVSGPVFEAIKRASDIGIGIAMMVLTLPLMVATALAVKFDTPGPVFYRQQRIGRFGRPFTLLKFRSMTADAEAGGKPRWAQKQDPRVTRVGRFIRASRIDELPQLANVIRGEMSLVGPRPERPVFVEQLAEAIPFYHQREYVRPGLTGWAQVNFPYGASVEDAREKLAYDLYYVKYRTIWMDLLILLSTVRVVLFREGAR